MTTHSLYKLNLLSVRKVYPFTGCTEANRQGIGMISLFEAEKLANPNEIIYKTDFGRQFFAFSTTSNNVMEIREKFRCPD